MQEGAMGRKRCSGCGEWFRPRGNVPHQRFCSKGACQRARRAHWQREKLKQDPDYRVNQAMAQRRWCAGRRDYWRRYRQSHPEYTARNRAQQRERNRRRRQSALGAPPRPIAKMDGYESQTPIISGTYRLIPVGGSEIAKMDAYLVKMQVLSGNYDSLGGDCKERT